MTTLETLIARHEIEQALIMLARAMDERDWDMVAAILAEDIVFDLGEGVRHGSAAFISTLRRYLDCCGPTQHLLGNLIVDAEGAAARSRCYVSDMHVGAGDRAHLTLVTLGDYHDHWRNIDGTWRMVARVKHNRALIGAPEIFE